MLVARFLVHDIGMEMLAGICALGGHIWPVFLRFRGGRGAAVAVGVLMATLPLIALPLGALSLVALYHTRKAMVALAMFLIGIPFLAWPAGYPVAIGGLCLPHSCPDRNVPLLLDQTSSRLSQEAS